MPDRTPDTEAPLSGTRFEGASDEQETSRRVREMFSGIAPRYDFLNHFLSGRLDNVWRRRVARRFAAILARPEARVLDLCCGTGDLAFALAREGSAAQITGADFSPEMLAIARRKAAARSESAARGAIEFVEADALHLPFGDATFDLVTTAFGFRNLANYDEGLKEIRRVLRPGGEIGILEFSEPKGKLFGALYRFYFRRILPTVGGAISGNAAAYSYLPRSVGRFPSPEELAAQMERARFDAVRFERWTGGIVALHTGRRA
ncbi:MAG: bifunctional demethylmenaquinone methyltransferase/2-methoxy-6-polyprenyl-1,4-benzoquinol methylase UbiE [Candidatus Acidiferrales bacterium]